MEVASADEVLHTKSKLCAGKPNDMLNKNQLIPTDDCFQGRPGRPRTKPSQFLGLTIQAIGVMAIGAINI